MEQVPTYLIFPSNCGLPATTPGLDMTMTPLILQSLLIAPDVIRTLQPLKMMDSI